ncbi:uncharacterized protein LOC124113317 [Haliotis rufescens]|uniref:uncharacterized protein LOC124113317 n=1 Tax=Haliotis rufescens TaxID=6454 RepID=UPI001EAFAAE1|nr:uncharacterized protein LOC124113317 [Haliotis rufescens]
MGTEISFERLHVDILGSLPKTQRGNKYVLLAIDSFSKWTEAFPMKTQEASEVAYLLFNEVFTRYGAQRTLLTDNGRQFTSKLVNTLCELMDVKHYTTSPYHPESIGECERRNSTITQNIIDNLKVAQEIARENIAIFQKKSKAHHDQKVALPKFQVGDTVLMNNQKVKKGCSLKLTRKWTGPWYISNIGLNHTYKVRDRQTQKEYKSYVHANRLKPYTLRPNMENHPDFHGTTADDVTNQITQRQANDHHILNQADPDPEPQNAPSDPSGQPHTTPSSHQADPDPEPRNAPPDPSAQPHTTPSPHQADPDPEPQNAPLDPSAHPRSLVSPNPAHLDHEHPKAPPETSANPGPQDKDLVNQHQNPDWEPPAADA